MLSSIGVFDFGSLWNRRFTSAPACPAATSCSPSAMTRALSFTPRKRMDGPHRPRRGPAVFRAAAQRY
eukprot:7157144-Pyramimonas_sp.AAC.1